MPPQVRRSIFGIGASSNSLEECSLPFLSRGARNRDRNEIAAAEQGGAEQELRHGPPA
jgi:hypothetical protein